MPHELECPHCSCPLLTVQGSVRVPDVDTVEMLHREIAHLRATVARLRGTGFNPLPRNLDGNPAPS
ncbi:MAG: hypothetical protein M3228_10465 [Actinomycetota bacterium]|nr:hypothetical protein [Actinomycetota bacterium]